MRMNYDLIKTRILNYIIAKYNMKPEYTKIVEFTGYERKINNIQNYIKGTSIIKNVFGKQIYMIEWSYEPEHDFNNIILDITILEPIGYDRFNKVVI